MRGLQFFKKRCVAHYIRMREGWRKKPEQEVALGASLESDTAIQIMVQSKEKWNWVKKFVGEVISTKEEEEREAQSKIVVSLS